MEMRHVRYFAAAAEEQNISKAARRLHVSQSAISRLIRDLEEELDTTLFIRERHGLSLTSAGDKLLVYAHQILRISDEAVTTIRGLSTASPSITIGFMASSAGLFFGSAIKAFAKTNPGIWIRFRELSPGDQLRLLRTRHIDIALIGNPSTTVAKEFTTTVLFEMEMMAVLPDTHPLARRKRIRLQELAHETFLGCNEEHYPGRNQTIAEACRLAGFTPVVGDQANSLLEVLTMVGTGRGVCLMPIDVVNLPHPGVVFLAVTDNLDLIRFTAAWRRDDDRPAVAQLVAALGHATVQRSQKRPLAEGLSPQTTERQPTTARVGRTPSAGPIMRETAAAGANRRRRQHSGAE